MNGKIAPRKISSIRKIIFSQTICVCVTGRGIPILFIIEPTKNHWFSDKLVGGTCKTHTVSLKHISLSLWIDTVLFCFRFRDFFSGFCLFLLVSVLLYAQSEYEFQELLQFVLLLFFWHILLLPLVKMFLLYSAMHFFFA